MRRIKPDINLVPYFLCTFYLTQMIFDTQQLEKAITDKNRSEIAMYRKRALKTAKVAIKTARKSAADITESLKLMGTYYWILGKQRMAKQRYHSIKKRNSTTECCLSSVAFRNLKEQ